MEALLAAPAQVEDRAAMRAFLVEQRVSGAMAEWLMMNLARAEGGYRWKIDRTALARLVREGNREDLWPAVENAMLKVRVIRGGASGFVSDEDVARFLRAGVAVLTIAGAGHFIHVDAPAELLRALVAPANPPAPGGRSE